MGDRAPDEQVDAVTVPNVDTSKRWSAERPSRSFRGYDRSATDQLLVELESDRSKLQEELARLGEHVGHLEADLARHEDQERLVAKTLVAATGHATTIKENARREAEQLLTKVRGELDRRIEQAERVERERVQAERELVRLRHLAQEMQISLESFLTEALGQLAADHEPGSSMSESDSARNDLVRALSEPLRDVDVESGSEAATIRLPS